MWVTGYGVDGDDADDGDVTQLTGMAEDEGAVPRLVTGPPKEVQEWESGRVYKTNRIANGRGQNAWVFEYV